MSSGAGYPVRDVADSSFVQQWSAGMSASEPFLLGSHVLRADAKH